MSVKKRNLELPAEIDVVLEQEKRAGTSITKTVSAAVYWYINRLDPVEREVARLECSEWVHTGRLPPSKIADQLSEVLQSARERELRRSLRGS